MSCSVFATSLQGHNVCSWVHLTIEGICCFSTTLDNNFVVSRNIRGIEILARVHACVLLVSHWTFLRSICLLTWILCVLMLINEEQETTAFRQTDRGSVATLALVSSETTCLICRSNMFSLWSAPVLCLPLPMTWPTSCIPLMRPDPKSFFWHYCSLVKLK